MTSNLLFISYLSFFLYITNDILSRFKKKCLFFSFYRCPSQLKSFKNVCHHSTTVSFNPSEGTGQSSIRRTGWCRPLTKLFFPFFLSRNEKTELVLSTVGFENRLQTMIVTLSDKPPFPH
jgi:hypothetical protein